MIHLNEVLYRLKPKRGDKPHTVEVFCADGRLIGINNCFCIREYPRRGTRLLRVATSGEIRQIRDFLIYRFDGDEVAM